MESFGVRLVMEAPNMFGASHYEVVYENNIVTVPVKGELTDIILTKDIVPNKNYTFLVYLVYTDGFKTNPTTVTYTTNNILFSNLIIEFSKTPRKNIKLEILPKKRYSLIRIKRYNYVEQANYSYLINTYEIRGTNVLEIPDIYTNDLFVAEYYVLADEVEQLVGQSQPFKCPYDASDFDYLQPVYKNDILTFDFKTDFAFNYVKLTLTKVIDNNNIYIEKISLGQSISINVYENFYNSQIIPEIPYKIEFFNDKDELILTYEDEFHIPDINITNMQIIILEGGVKLTCPIFDVPVSTYYFYHKDYLGNEYQFIETYENSVIDRHHYKHNKVFGVRVKDIYNRYSNKYFEELNYKSPKSPTNIKFQVDKLTKNITLIWDNPYLNYEEDFIDIKHFKIVTKSNVYFTKETQFIIPKIEIGIVQLSTIDILETESHPVFVNLDIPKPPTPCNLQAAQVGTHISLMWEVPYYEYLDSYEIRLNGWNSARVLKNVTSTYVTFEIPCFGLTSFYVKAKSILGEYSDDSASCTINIVPTAFTNNITTYSFNNITSFVNAIYNNADDAVDLRFNEETSILYFDKIEYGSVCKSFNYATEKTFTFYSLDYTWTDFEDADNTDPFPPTTTFNDVVINWEAFLTENIFNVLNPSNNNYTWDNFSYDNSNQQFSLYTTYENLINTWDDFQKNIIDKLVDSNITAETEKLLSLNYTWGDFDDENLDDPFPFSTTFQDLQINWTIFLEELKVVDRMYYYTNKIPYESDYFFPLYTNLYNSKNSFRLYTEKGDDFLEFTKGFLDYGCKLKNNNFFSLPVNKGISFTLKIPKNSNTYVCALKSDNETYNIGFIDKYCMVYNVEFFKIPFTESDLLVSVKIKDNFLKLIINDIFIKNIILPSNIISIKIGGFI